MSHPPFLSQPAHPRPKKLVICCDGTWQSSTSLDPDHGTPSNVARLSRIVANAGNTDGVDWQQVVYYDAGVGTGDLSGLEKKRQGSQGLGLLENVIEAYNFIVNNYSPGDQLFFFGFSRGAFTVRSAAGLVTELGVIRPSSFDRFLALYAKYIETGEFGEIFSKTEPWKAFVEEKQRNGNGRGHAVEQGKDVVVQVIGVWDTVGALGIPDIGHIIKVDNSFWRKQYEFHDTDLNPSVQHAFQALALDEQRASFSPSIWHLAPINQTTELIQAWFSGAHSNLGGGSSARDDEGKLGTYEQLSYISYVWMLDRVRPYLALDPDELEAQKEVIGGVIRCAPDELAKTDTKDSATKGWIGTRWEFLKGRASSMRDKVYGYAGGTIVDSHTFGYDLLAFPKPREPLDLTVQEKEKGVRTGEVVHPSVWYRQESQRRSGQVEEKDIYQPIAMKGWTRETDGESGQFRWIKRDKEGRIVKSMPEFEIGRMPAQDSLERWLIDRSWCDTVHERVKNDWKNS